MKSFLLGAEELEQVGLRDADPLGDRLDRRAVQAYTANSRHGRLDNLAAALFLGQSDGRSLTQWREVYHKLVVTKLSSLQHGGAEWTSAAKLHRDDLSVHGSAEGAAGLGLDALRPGLRLLGQTPAAPDSAPSPGSPPRSTAAPSRAPAGPSRCWPGATLPRSGRMSRASALTRASARTARFRHLPGSARARPPRPDAPAAGRRRP